MHLNIISFNIPYPPDYGGVIDVFYKIKALHSLNIKIHLHCFGYGRMRSEEELKKYCQSVQYYKRNAMWQGIASDKPYIVFSRRSSLLRNILAQNTYPILFEGLHCCFFLNDPAFKGRIKIVRMHNDEDEYYLALAKREKNILKRIYFYAEYKRLHLFEKILQHANLILAISLNEANHFKKMFPHTAYFAPFHGNEFVTSKTGSYDFALYHGNLSINENEEAALYLIEKIFHDLAYKLYIAGNYPSAELASAAKKYANVTLIANPSVKELDALMRDAQMHVLPAFQDTGIKLKLVNALYKGRFCIVNKMMVENTGLEKYCIVADSEHEMKSSVLQTFQKEFSAADIEFRKNIEKEFSDIEEAKKFIDLLNRAHL